MYSSHRIRRSPSSPVPERQPDAVERRRKRRRTESHLGFALFYCSKRSREPSERLYKPVLAGVSLGGGIWTLLDS